MDKKTAEALEASIRLWEARITTPTEAGGRNCPLCLLFNSNFAPDVDPDEQDECARCPVAARTGEPLCHGTPYGDYYHVLREYPVSDNRKTEARRQAALFTTFLKSLREPQE